MKPVTSSSLPALASAAAVLHLNSFESAKQTATSQHQQLIQLWQQSKLRINRRHSFDDNGGGYNGL
jgi:hypothetical protein